VGDGAKKVGDEEPALIAPFGAARVTLMDKRATMELVTRAP